MKKSDKIVVIVLILVALLALQAIVPFKIYGPVYLENRKLDRYELVSSYIAKFKEKEGRMPKSFAEIDKAFSDVFTENNLSQVAKDFKSSGIIKDCSGQKIVFEVEAVWEGDENEELLWARTKNGEVIRFKKYLLKESTKK